MDTSELSWVEVSEQALRQNVRNFKKHIGSQALLCVAVKGNAYGHGLVESARVFLEAGADWLCVNALFEARALRKAGFDCPIYIMGYVPLGALAEVVALKCRLVVYNKETIDQLVRVLEGTGKKIKVHIKVETGNNRQGVLPEILMDFARYIDGKEDIELEGIGTHFANIEDTTDHSYAMMQLERFNRAIEGLEAAGIDVPLRHCANSAATLLFPMAHYSMVRLGLGAYGMWPSEKVAEVVEDFELEPALCWKTRIVQVKEIKAGECVGYGCTFEAQRDMRIAILPVGYYDGYDRGISEAFVLVHGKKAALCGRVCMNIIMIDVTEIDEAMLEDEVVLIGRNGDEEVSAEMFAAWAGTINYEVTTRINERIPRIII
ncbi:alanine racemase [Patescibacteria group bacterium]|nr:alanine racemase [Patescibacteria group bacterium]